MNGFDVLFVLTIIWGAWMGWHKGFVRVLFGFIGFALGLYVAYRFYEQAGYLIAPHIGTSPTMGSILAFAGIWIGVPILLWVLGSLLTSLLKLVQLGTVNRLAGCLLSVGKYTILLGILANVLALTHIATEEAQNSSIFFKPLKQTTDVLFQLAQQQWR
ncbi:MAG: CvpA family protein [Bacteroidaceae bacterium]|nr:CvpA family protein [Bacteroidaceae bacterium]